MGRGGLISSDDAARRCPRVTTQLPEDELKAYFLKHPAVKQGGWRPWAPARLILELPRYSPAGSLGKVAERGIPVQMITAAQVI